jgi:hypothetical protein
LSERIHDAFWGYVEMVQMSALPCDVRDRIEEAYRLYGQALAEASQPIDLQRKVSEFSVEYLRALQGLGRMEDAVTPYAALLQAALQAGLGQERLLGCYERLAAVLLDATKLYGRRDKLESAYSQYIDVVRRAWLDQEPGGLSAEAVLDASRGILAVGRDGRSSLPPRRRLSARARGVGAS